MPQYDRLSPKPADQCTLKLGVCSGNLNSLYQRGVMLHQAFPRYCHAGKHIVSFYNVASQPSLGSSRNTPSQFPPRSVTVCDGPNAFAKYSIGLAS